jgi:hypothetical protein
MENIRELRELTDAELDSVGGGHHHHPGGLTGFAGNGFGGNGLAGNNLFGLLGTFLLLGNLLGRGNTFINDIIVFNFGQIDGNGTVGVNNGLSVGQA